MPAVLSERDVDLLQHVPGLDPSEVGRRLPTHDLLEAWCTRDDVRSRLGVALNSRASASLLMTLAADKARHVREAVAGHPNCPPAVWEALAADAYQVQCALIETHSLPESLALRIAHSDAVQARIALARQPWISEVLLRLLADDIDPRVSMEAELARNRST